MRSALMTEIIYGAGGSTTNANSRNFIRQNTFLERVMASLDADDGIAIREMEECRKQVSEYGVVQSFISPILTTRAQLVSNIRVFVSTNLMNLPSPYLSASNMFAETDLPSSTRTGQPSPSLRDYSFASFPQVSALHEDKECEAPCEIAIHGYIHY